METADRNQRDKESERNPSVHRRLRRRWPRGMARPSLSHTAAGVLCFAGRAVCHSFVTTRVPTAIVAAVLMVAVAAAPASAQAEGTGPGNNPVGAFLAGTELSGLIDGYYAYNLNTPDKPCALVGGVKIFNCLHDFDVAHDAFSLSLAELALEKKPTTASRAGYRVDFDFGPAAAIVGDVQQGGAGLHRNIQQAYFSVLAPVTAGGLRLDVGKFVTPAGFEVIETNDNWNYSHSLLFALAVPYYHMGLRATLKTGDAVTLTGLVVNGWNNVTDNNGGKTLGLSASLKPANGLAVTETYIAGPETTRDDRGWRHLSDTVVTYGAGRTTSVAVNYDIGQDRNSNQRWQGVAGYVRFRPSGWFALVPRYEFLNDRDGFMTGVSQKVQEATVTAELRHQDGMLMRIEYRTDRTQQAFFLKSSSESVKLQGVLTVGVVYWFTSKG